MVEYNFKKKMKCLLQILVLYIPPIFLEDSLWHPFEAGWEKFEMFQKKTKSRV